MADNVLQSFVIQLKYLVDDASQKKFHDTVTQGVSGLNAFRLSMLAAAVGVEEFVRRTTNVGTQLSGLSKETNTTALAIERLRARFEGAHLSAQQADASLRSFMELMRQPSGRIQAFNAIRTQFTDFDDFMVKAGERYRRLMAQYGSESNANVVAYRNQLNAIASGLADQVRIIAQPGNWERSQRIADQTIEIYKRLGVSAAQYAKDSDDAGEAFRRVNKTLEVGMIEFLTHTDAQGHTVLQTIEKIATSFADWLGDENTQKQFTRFLDDVNEALPYIEKALEHIDVILGGLVTITVLNWGSKAVASLIAFRNTLFAVGGGLRYVATSADLAAAAVRRLTVAYLAWEGAKAAKKAFTGELHEKQEQNLGPTPWYAPDIDPLYLAGKFWRSIFGGDKPPSQPDSGGDQDNTPHFQHGGIVSAALHAGEMVLPANISAGLQSFFGWGYGGITDTLRRQYEQFVEWFAGDSSYKPQVSLDDQTIDNLVEKLTGEAAAKPGGAGDGAAPGTKPPGSDITGGGPTSVPTFSGGTAQQQAMDYFIKQGWTKEQAAGIVANLQVESHLDPRSKGDSGLALGIGQWHPDRQANFRRVFGHDIKESTYAEQLAFVQWELTNTESNAGKRLKAAVSPLQAGGVVSQFYERPRDVQGNIALRGRRAAGISATYQPGETVSTGTTVTPPGAGTPLPDSGAGGGQWLGGKTAGVRPELVQTLKAAVEQFLPQGVTAQVTSGEREGDPRSQHFHGGAMDIQLFKDGKPISNRGGDVSGYYTQLAHGFYNETARLFPQLLSKVAWGGEFGTRIGGGGEQDLMHFDYGGRRGHYKQGPWAFVDQVAKLNDQLKTNNQSLKTNLRRIEDRNAARSVAVNSPHRTKIIVYGSDAHVTAKAIEQTQNRVAANHLRNMRSVVS